MDALVSSDQCLPPTCPRHDWQPIDGWTARYRCQACSAVGYKPRAVTAEVQGGPYGRSDTTPYVCAVVRAGLQCRGPAVAKRGRMWRCRGHLLGKRAHEVTSRKEHHHG